MPFKIENNKLLDINFWKKINPDFHINEKDFIASQKPINFQLDEIESAYSDLLEEGYLQKDPVEWNLPIPKMAEAVRQFADFGWPTVFVFVYDEFFLLPYKLSGILNKILGKDFMLLPDFWAWYVDPLKAEKGWAPHRDKGIDSLTEDRKPKSFTLWIPLTDVSTKNGCINVIPANWDPYFISPENNSTKFDPQNIRALPAKAGSVLGWNQAVLHWGGRSSKKANNPRISVAFELQRNDVSPFNNPLFSSIPLPNLNFRLKLIGKQILQYKHMYPLTDEMKNIAEFLLGL